MTMKNGISNFILICATASCLGFSALADAKEIASDNSRIIPRSIVLDGTKYLDVEILNSFMTAAFSYSVPPFVRDRAVSLYADSEFRSKKIGSFDVIAPHNFKTEYPWLYEALYREEGDPRFAAINKWDKPITISFGYPNDLKPVESGNRKEKNPNDDGSTLCCSPPINSEKEAAAINSLNKIIPLLVQDTQLSISIVPRAEDKQSGWSNLRIILEDGEQPSYRAYNANHEKAAKGWHEISAEDSTEYEDPRPPVVGIHSTLRRQLLKTVVNFTPESPYGVDGFFVSSSDNHIQQAFCFVSSKLSDVLFASAVQECLLRSLGLPEKEMQIGDARSKLTPLLANDLSKLNSLGTLTEKDRFLLKLLYSSQLGAGSSFTKTLKILSEGK